MDRSDRYRALLLIDFQDDFLADHGRMPVTRNQVEPVLAAARAAIAQARARGDLIVQIGNEFRPHDLIGNLLRRGAAISGRPGTRWDPRFAAPGAVYVAKWKSDAFCNPALENLLREHHIQEISVAGLYARACVAATTKAALARGFQVHVLADAVACRSDASREAALGRLRGFGAQVIHGAANL
ncbi:MAG: cysteine hydrolase family protein [Micromonosporaceae bacterium]